MITAETREKLFREALLSMLERHGAEMIAADDGKPWGMHTPLIHIRMGSVYDDEGNLIADYADFDL